jgi:rhodanese-related sulfurtransferase
MADDHAVVLAGRRVPMLDRARMYVCGITPYDVTHLGHAATFVWVDALARVLRLLGSTPKSAATSPTWTTCWMRRPPGPARPGGDISSYRVADFGGLAAEWGRPGLVVLDVRRLDEWRAGHLARAVHVPFWEVESRAAEVPAGEVWVHCASGFRASIAASILQRGGRRVVHVDDDWENAARSGLPLGT